jgi:hypothetical protein
MQSDPWDDEQIWSAERYSPVYVANLQATLSPTRAGDQERNQARDALQRSLLIDVILIRQRADGSWPLGGPPWFRVYPIPLLVLLEYGLRDHPAVQRGLEYLLGTLADGRFPWPRHEPHDPREYYVAFQGRCLQVMALASLASDPRVQDVASNLFHRQRWDGGWGTKPQWMFHPDEPKPDPWPSCWICTLEVMRGLGRVLSFPTEALRQLFSFWATHASPSPVRQARTLTALRADDVGVLLACLEFCANQGLHASDPAVEQFLEHLDAARGADGRFPRLSDYYGVLANHLTWRLTSSL